MEGDVFMYNIITIERRYASGGNEIGKRLADALGYKLYDRNILMEAAQKLDIPFLNHWLILSYLYMVHTLMSFLFDARYIFDILF